MEHTKLIQSNNIEKGPHTIIKWGLFQDTKITQHSQISVIHHMNKMKDKITRSSEQMQENHYKNSIPVHDKNKTKPLNMCKRGIHHNIIRTIYNKLIVNIIMNRKAKSMYSKFRKKTRMPTFCHFYLI